MTKSCGVMPVKLTKIHNKVVQSLIKQDIPADKARRQSAALLLNRLQAHKVTLQVPVENMEFMDNIPEFNVSNYQDFYNNYENSSEYAPTTIEDIYEIINTRFKENLSPSSLNNLKSLLTTLYPSITQALPFTIVTSDDLTQSVVGRENFDPSSNSVMLSKNSTIKTTIHEIIHAATYYGIEKGLSENDPDLVIFKSLLENHKEAVLKEIGSSTDPLLQTVKYIYQGIAGDAESVNRDINEAMAVLGSNVEIRKAWVKLLKKVDPTNSVKSENLLRKILQKISSHIQQFIDILLKRDVNLGVEQTQALELFYKAFSAAMQRNNTKITRNKDVLDNNSFFNSKEFGSTGNRQQHPYAVTAATVIQSKADINTIFDEIKVLGNNNKQDSSAHAEQLEHVVKDLIVPLANQLNGVTFITQESSTATNPSGKYEETKSGNTLIKDIYLSVSSIAKPFLNRFRLSFQEIAAHEFVHATTTAAYDSGNYAIRKGIRTLYEQAKAVVKPSDFSQTVDGITTTAAENQETYDYIFNNPDGQGVQEFMAFGLTNEVFRGILAKIIIKEERVGKNLIEKIEILFEKIVNFLIRKTLKIQGKTADVALETLYKELTGISAKHQSYIDYASVGLEITKGVGSATLNQIVKPLTKLVTHPNSPKAVKAVFTIGKAWQMGSKLKLFAGALGTTLNNLVKHKEYFFVNLLLKLPQELAGMNVTNKAWHDLLKHSKQIVDAARHKIKDATITHVREALGVMDDDAKRALTSAIIMTDLDDLQTYGTNFTFTDYRKVLADDSYRHVWINKIETELRTKFGNTANGYIRQAMGLGMFMQTKQTINDGYQALNAHAIARGDWDSKFNQPTNWDEAIPLLQQLKTLYSINNTTQFTRNSAVAFFDTHANTSLDKDNGFNTLVSLNKLFKQEAQDKLFKNDPTHAVAGYVKDINLPDVMLKFSSDPDDKALKDQGFVRQENPLGQSNYHKHEKNYLYVANHNGLVPYNKMTASLTSIQLAGTSLTDLLVNKGWDYANAAGQAKADSALITASIDRKEMYSTKMNLDTKASLIPVFDGSGNIVNHRYVMTEDSRKKVLGKDTRIDNVLGVMFESITDKVESKNINKEVVKELVNEYKTMYSKSSKGFITVTKNHPKYGEIYKLLPKEMKEDLDAAFGDGKIVVREAMMDIIFGYRKYSLFTQGDNSWLAKAMKAIIIGLFKVSPHKYYRYGRMTEQAWQEIIQELKSVIVLKTNVLGFNILSNTIVSFMHGMPLNYITKKQGEAALAVEDYVNSYRKQLVYTQKLKTIGISTSAKVNLESKIKQIEQELLNSPIKPLIDEGLLNSIVEDISLDDSEFGIKGDVSKFIAAKTKWIPKPVKTAYDVVQIGQKTALYKLLEKSTRYSDFVARHAMYSWYTQEKKMAKDEAVQLVTETFVNYDLPTSAELQYLNDVGLWMFTKYAVRIQKTIYKMLRDKPESIVGLMVVQGMFGNVTDPTDSLAFFPGLPRNPVNSMDEMVLPLFQLIKDIF